MKLLFAIKSLNVKGGGAERVLVDVANGLSQRGHEIQILTFDSPGKSFYEIDPGIRRLDTGIGSPGRPTPRSRFLRAIPAIRRAVRLANPDLAVVFMHSTYVPMSIALVGTGVSLVACEHVDSRHFQSRPFQKFLVRLAERLVIAKTVPSAPMLHEHPENIKSHVHVIPNPVDVGAYFPIANTKPSRPLRVTSIGRLMEEKGHIYLVRAFAEVENRFPDWSLRLVGDGVLRPKLEQEIIRLQLGTRVELSGYTRDVSAEYAAASIVALPSLYESFGMVAAEALAAGRPVIAFADCLGIAEMIESGKNGLLVEPSADRVTSFAKGLEQLMSNPSLRSRLAASGPDSVRKFALNDVVDRWEELLVGLQSR